MCIPRRIYAQNNFEVVYIGEVEQTNETYRHKENSYPLYKVKSQIFIAVDMLQNIGFQINEDEGIYYIQSLEPLAEVKWQHVPIEGSAYMAQYPIYCGNIRSYALKVNDRYLMPIEALQALGRLKYNHHVYWLEEDFQNELQLLTLNEEGIENNAEHIMKLVCKHIYWNGKAYEVIEEEIFLEVGEKKAWQLPNETKKVYVTTLVEEINEWKALEQLKISYGEQKESIFKAYSDAIYLRKLTTIFPPCIVEGQMKYAIGPLKEKEVVEVCRSEKRYYFSVKNQQGNKYQVPYQSVHVIGEKGARLPKVSKEAIEDFATLSGIQSATDYLIWTDLYRQRTYVLKKEMDKWHLEQSFICSTGKLNNPTPAGFYEVQYMIPYIGVQKGYRCKYALVFFRDYMYHSILFDKTGKYIKSGQYELGSKASHGCIRLSEKDSEWLYKHIPVKTTVWIR